jgi:hypothetical protein
MRRPQFVTLVTGASSAAAGVLEAETVQGTHVGNLNL